MLIDSDNEENEDNEDFPMFDPQLIDLDDDSDNNNLASNSSVAATSQETFLLPSDEFYDMCFQLHHKQ